jgi:Ca-activated chloride channel family protein
MKKGLIPLLINLLFLVILVQPVKADGIIIPDPPFPPTEPFPMKQLEITYHHVNVSIKDQVAVTRVDQVFFNPNEWAVEGVYFFPLPKDAAVSAFTLWIDGEPVKGEILDADQARQEYEKIVRQMRDPALLEYTGQGAVKAQIFPIAPGEKRRIELEYQEVLTAENGLVRYVYPLNTEKFSAQPLEDVKISVSLQSEQPIRAVYSPTHPIDISRENENRITAGYEENQVTPDKDFALYYSIGESKALHLLSYRDKNNQQDSDGYFLLLLAPSPKDTVEIISKDIMLILDHSGSMEGEKFRQAQAALKYILQHLNPEDHFYITAFSTSVETYSNHLVPADQANDAIDWVIGMSAEGSTDINRALLETISFADPERPTYIIFLTDGLPTEGVTESSIILKNFAEASNNNIRLFPFGVGYDVDTYLLDSLSEDHHGLSTYVHPGEPLDEILSAFYSKISTPVLTNIQIDFGDLTVYDIYPQPLPDLFEGSQIVITGRYQAGGNFDVTLEGEINSKNQVFEYPEQSFAVDNSGESSILAILPRIWATRKIGYLLNKIRLEGPEQETIEQIVQLSIHYGIVTPYTSYLVTEPMPLGASNQQELARDVYEEALAAPAEVAGQQAVTKADEEGKLYQAEVVPTVAGGNETIRTIWSHTFVFKEGVWMDSAFDPDKMQPMQVGFLTDEYFQLASLRSDISAFLALSNHMILVIEDKAYEINPEQNTESEFMLPEIQLDPTAVQNETPKEAGTPQAPVNTVQTPQISSDEELAYSRGKLNPFILAGVLAVGLLFLVALIFRRIFHSG